jgi:DNA-binding CsgD family transcriptional regulator
VAALVTRRQFEVLEHVARGLANKQVAHELQISLATVGTHLRRAKARLGVSTRVELICCMARIGPAQRCPQLKRLTPAERRVAIRILAGQSNAEIARTRGRAERTVANQVSSIFQKLGVSSRSELCALIAAAQSGDRQSRDAGKSPT